jgi:hypothetical protein
MNPAAWVLSQGEAVGLTETQMARGIELLQSAENDDL